METGQKLRYFFAAVLLIAFFVFLLIGLNQVSEILFVGYMVIAGGLLISSVILFATARFEPSKEKPTENAE